MELARVLLQTGRTVRPTSLIASLGSGLVLILALLALPSANLYSQTTVQLPELEPQSYPITSDLDQVQFYLITVDVGNKVWDNFGHTALRLVDESNGTDLVFNWGLFDASAGVLKFSYDFFVGIMNYQLGTAPLEFERQQYRQQRRTLWQDRINLSNDQKEILYRRLIWNVQAENRVYPYQYFYDNCTTRVRDYLNEALAGRIQLESTASSNVNYRAQVFDYYRSVGLIGFSLDITMNSDVDRNISQWENMFLPLNLRQGLMKMPSDLVLDGQRQMLLSDGEMLDQFETPATQINGYWFAMSLLLLPAGLLVALLRLRPDSTSRVGKLAELQFPAISYRLLGVLGLVVCIFSGIYGLLMLGSWLFSEHTVLHHNLNLLLFWPTDLLGVILAVVWMFQAGACSLSVGASKVLNFYLLAHLLAALLYLLINLLGLSAQSVSNVLIFLLPGFLLFLLLTKLVGFRRQLSQAY